MLGRMKSRARERWEVERAAALDEREAAHRSVGGTGACRRVATQQINRAYVLLLCAQFQAFCRDLHTEAIAQVLGAEARKLGKAAATGFAVGAPELEDHHFPT